MPKTQSQAAWLNPNLENHQSHNDQMEEHRENVALLLLSDQGGRGDLAL